MPTIQTTIESDFSPEGLAADIRALKVAVGLIAAKIPKDHNPYSICDSLDGIGEHSTSELSAFIREILDKAHHQP